MNSYYNIFVGTENGILKGVNSKSKTFNNLNSMENLDREKEIVAMCWCNDYKQDQIYFVTKDRHVVKYDCDHKNETPFEDLGQFDFGAGEIKSIESLPNDQIVTCTDSGVIKLWSLTRDTETGQLSKKIMKEHLAGSNVICMRKSAHSDKGSCLVATGGKENDLKVWNLAANGKEPIFRAKNMPDNWIQLREPVHITCIDFLDQNRIVVGTAHHQVRVYDIKSGIRRPVANFIFGQHPITACLAVPNEPNRVIVANTFGDVQMLDIKQTASKQQQSNLQKADQPCLGLQKYKGFQGTVKSMQLAQLVNNESTSFYLATCGLDRFLRVHSIESGQLAAKVFLKSRLNCLLFSKHAPLSTKKAKTGADGEKIDDELASNVESEDLGTEDLWSDMDTIIEKYGNEKESSKKKKINKRLRDFEDDDDEDEENRSSKQQDPDDAFLKPRPVKAPKAAKKPKISN